MDFFQFNFLNRYSRSWKWANVRKEHLSTQPTCQACGKSNDLIVHHIEPVHLNPNRELDPSNLITLCSKPCHIVFGHFMDYKSWNKNVVQDCNMYLSKIKIRPYYENYASKPSIGMSIRNLINKFCSFWDD